MAKKSSPLSSVRPNKFLTILLSSVAVLLFVISGWLWWSRLYQSPERVFQAMLANSLSTPSVTRHVTQAAGGNSLEQYVQLNLGSENRARIVSTLAQTANQSTTEVGTESIGTPDQDYSRYTTIKTNEQNDAGEPLDFSSVINVWGESELAGTTNPTQPRYLNEALLGVVPFGGLPANERQTLLEFMRDNNVFQTDFNSVARTTQNGRNVYIYNVTIEPSNYIAMLQAFTKALGLEPIEGLEQESYEGTPPLQIAVSVDRLSRQLTKVAYAGDGREETYSGHGLTRPIDLPEQTIPLNDLQNRLQTIR